MPAQGRHHAMLRLLRLMAALSLIIALAAVATIVNGDTTAKSQALVAVAIGMGSCALLGMALVAAAHFRRRKGWNDRRS